MLPQLPPPQSAHATKPTPEHFKPLPRPRTPPTWLIHLPLAYSLAFCLLALWVMETHP